MLAILRNQLVVVLSVVLSDGALRGYTRHEYYGQRMAVSAC